MSNNNSSAIKLNCQWCGNFHPDMKCPLITSIEYYSNGTIKSIGFIAGLVENESLIPIKESL